MLAGKAGWFAPLLAGAIVFGCSHSASDQQQNSEAGTPGAGTLTGPVVIGAGIAGARAAYELQQAGVTNITLIAPAKAPPDDKVPDTGLTTTLTLDNGGTADVGATLFPGTYELLGPARKLGLPFVTLSSKIAIVRGGSPVVIDQANPTTLYTLFTPSELTPSNAVATQGEITRLMSQGFNHRDGRLYAGESRTIQQYLTQFVGDLPASYLGILPKILASQDVTTSSAGFEESLFVMTSPNVYSLPEMQSLPLKLIEASGATVELAKVSSVTQGSSGTVIQGKRASGETVSWTTTAPVIVAVPTPIAAGIINDAGPEEQALLKIPMLPVNAVTVELTPGWQRPANLSNVTYGGVPDVERGSGNVIGWGLDYRSPAGTELVVGLMLQNPATDQTAIDAAVHEANKYLPGLEAHVKKAVAVVTSNHAPTLTPAFYQAVAAYWTWIDTTPGRHIVLAGSASNQYGMDGASFSGKLAAEAVLKKMGLASPTDAGQ
jgi:hypothetical protein